MFRRYYGPEFAGRTLDAWAYRTGVMLRFIRPGKPIENAYVKSFTGKFRDECLNEHWFVNFFQPSFKLASKIRIGAKVRKTYHAPETPYAKLMACVAISTLQ